MPVYTEKLHKDALFCTYLHSALANCLQILQTLNIMAATGFLLDKRSGDAPYPLKLTITHERKAVYLSLGFKLNPGNGMV